MNDSSRRNVKDRACEHLNVKSWIGPFCVERLRNEPNDLRRRNFARLACRKPARRGISLLEVLFAIAILAMSMVAIAQLVGLGTRSAASARDETKAQLLCQNKLVELVALPKIPTDQTDVELDEDANWTYSVAQVSMGTTGLVSVTVTVKQTRASTKRAASYSLTRWLINRESQVFAEPLEDAGL